MNNFKKKLNLFKSGHELFRTSFPLLPPRLIYKNSTTLKQKRRNPFSRAEEEEEEEGGQEERGEGGRGYF